MSDHQLPADPAEWPKDPHDVLGVPSHAPRDTIRRAYMLLVRRYKPEHAPEAFRRLREAYETALRWADYYSHFEPDESVAESAESAGAAEMPAAESGSPGAPRAATISLEEQLDACWRLACDGELENAQRRMEELRQRYPHTGDVYLRLYWLAAIESSGSGGNSGPGRHPCDVLVEGLRATGGQFMPLWELYRREILLHPAVGTSPPASKLFEDQPQTTITAEFAVWRIIAAARLQQWDAIAHDLQAMAHRWSRDEPATWLRILLAAADELAWSADPAAQAARRHCWEEIDRVGAVSPSDFDALARFDWLRDISQAWREMDRVEMPASLRAVLALSWSRPYWEYRGRALACLWELTENAWGLLQWLSSLGSKSGSLFWQFGTLLETMRDSERDSPDEDEAEGWSEAARTRALFDFVDSNYWPEYQDFRLVLSDFCLRESIQPEHVAEALKEQPGYWLAFDRRLSDAILEDWPLRYTCLAWRLVRG